ncbi:ArsR/SmtB family transcription factor [Dongia rigui]|uniref:Metalloregulator ArsR/SmtB family transcription factor n=1 Tax=Dongia rigui TaxID=940149 RepID=A0ABU5DVD7_9PROT|nr:metalloregulator ArsR/SmtB family transcription factor [Dongia rigui]MDY0871283.1 metalloregulator ArsR/SmtB family transcription factor [Dongia rigui]
MVQEAQQIVTSLGALAHEHRLAVYRLLVAKGPEGLAAGSLAETMAMPPSSLTFHLQQLLQAGLVTQRRLGRQIIYAADFANMNRLVAYLTENCCGGQACAPVCDPDPKESVAKGETENEAPARQRCR